MNILVLKTNGQKLDYALFCGEQREVIRTGKKKNYPVLEKEQTKISAELRQIRETCEIMSGGFDLDGVALRIPFGGSAFRGPSLVNTESKAKLEQLVPEAPLHLPGILKVIESCEKMFPRVPIGLVFETSFFIDLPAREHLYAIDSEIIGLSGIRRYGYHGIFHQAACQQVRRELKPNEFRGKNRILSVVLEPQPEVAAVVGQRPVMVTSGATPLEGICGETTCGLIDPSIVLTLAEKKGWGPEQINTVLTKESGVKGLLGKTVTLESVFRGDEKEIVAVRELIQYQILHACGAGIAAMGGLDGIVFSGRYVTAGENMGSSVLSKLNSVGNKPSEKIRCYYLNESLDQIIANQSVAILRAATVAA